MNRREFSGKETLMSKCHEHSTEAPVVGCGCRDCYGARELSLDPGLTKLARASSLSTTIKPSAGLIYRAIEMYCMGRLDYGAFHLAIITGLAELADHQFERLMDEARRSPLGQCVTRRDHGGSPQ